jgi:hypothetical protein
MDFNLLTSNCNYLFAIAEHACVWCATVQHVLHFMIMHAQQSIAQRLLATLVVAVCSMHELAHDRSRTMGVRVRVCADLY